MSQLILNILLSVSIYVLVGNSFSLIYYSTKSFNIAHAVIITLGAYLPYYLFHTVNYPLVFALPLGIIAATVIGISTELLVYKPLRRKNVLSLVYLIVSIGLYVILQNLISLFFGDDTKILYTREVTVGHNILGGYITTIQIITINISLVLLIGIVIFTQYTSLGKAIRAVSSNPELANIKGINSNKIILICFTIGSALGALAGLLSAFDTSMTPTMGFNLMLYGVVAMIIGGVGSYKSLIAGAFLVAVSQHLAAYYIDTKWMDAVAYIILILFLIWKPLGFSGKRLKKVEL